MLYNHIQWFAIGHFFFYRERFITKWNGSSLAALHITGLIFNKLNIQIPKYLIIRDVEVHIIFIAYG